MRHGNGVPARANRNAARKFSDNKQENDIQMTKGGIRMEPKFLRAEEVAQELSVSKPYAYKLIRQLNEELKSKGFLTISGRINREYFNERLYGARKEN